MKYKVTESNSFQTWLDNHPDRAEILNSEWTGEVDFATTINKDEIAFDDKETKLKWICNESHEFFMTLNYRTVQGHNCLFCGHETLDEYMNNNGEYGQQLREEFTGYDDKGNYYTPKDLTSKSGTRIIWRCKEGHEWPTNIYHRTVRHYQCPFCRSANTSYPEQYLYFALKEIYTDAKNRVHPYKLSDTEAPVEYDVLIPSLRLYIEYNGEKYHKGKEERDNMKRELAEQNGYKLIQIIDKKDIKEPIYTKDKIINSFSNNQNKNDQQLFEVISYLSKVLNFDINKIDFKEVKKNAFKYSHGEIPIEESAAYNYSFLLQEFNEELNPGISLYRLTKHSGKQIKWICQKCGYGSKGEWNNNLCSRTHFKSGCPKCGYNIFLSKYKRVSKKNIKSSVVFGEYTL